MNLMIGLAAVDEATGGKQMQQLANGWMGGRSAAHSAQTARAAQGEWHRQSLRRVAAVALGLGLLTGVVFGRASAETPAALPTPLVATHGTGPANEYAQADGGTLIFTANSRALYDGINPGFLGSGAGAAPLLASATNSHMLSDGINPGFLETSVGEAPSLAIGPAPATRPANASVADEYRWDFGGGPVAQRPVDASTATEYRWDFPIVATTTFVASLTLDPTRCDCFA